MDLWSDIIEHSMFTVFFSFKEELITNNGCVEMDIPWQLSRTMHSLLSQRFLLAGAKAQSRGAFSSARPVLCIYVRYIVNLYMIVTQQY